MIDFFCYHYSLIKDRNTFLKRIYFYSIERFALRLIANVILSILFKLTYNKPRLPECIKNGNVKIIVSLTSFPQRIKRVNLVIESILRQTYKPDMIILWLSDEEFSSIHELPKSLIRLQQRGLIIKKCRENLRAHKKYYYAMMEYPDDIIITIDDDNFYTSNTIEELIKTHKKYPFCVCANYTKKICFVYNNLLPYNEWVINNDHENISHQFLQIGLGGVLYPPHLLYKDIFYKDIFKEQCFLADDIWLKGMALLNNTPVIQTCMEFKILPIIYMKNATLSSINNNEAMNDKQIKNIREFYYRQNGYDIWQLNKLQV